MLDRMYMKNVLFIACVVQTCAQVQLYIQLYVYFIHSSFCELNFTLSECRQWAGIAQSV